MAEVHGDYLSPEFVAMAHRGGALLPANLGIENTLLAFRNAVELGFTYLETDVHATRDGELVAFHDDELTRVTDVVGKIRDFDFEEIADLRVGDREPIPTMAELFKAFPTARFNIDLKHPNAVEPLARVIKEHDAERRACVGSFQRSTIHRFRALMPRVPTAVSITGVAAMTMGALPQGGNVYQVPLSHQVGPMRLDIVTPRNIARIHATGRKIHVWTIDDATTMHRLLDWGVDGIVSDRPDLLKEVLRARGMWSTQ